MTKKRFELYTNEFKLMADSLPMLVSVTKNPDDETSEQFTVNHDRFLELPDIIKDKMASIKTSEKIQLIGKSYNLSTIQTSDIARAIRSFYFGELKIEDFPFHLAKEITIDLSKAKEITALVLREIIQDDSQEKAAAAQLENMTIAEALRNFPEIGEQLVTTDRINVLNFPEPARPSVKNWIADYTSALGRDTHDAIVRGNFIFHSPNGKTLHGVDRQKLAYLLKSLDEKTPLTINKTTRQIIFPAFSAPTQQPAPPRPVPQAPERKSAPNQPLWYPQMSSRPTPAKIQPAKPQPTQSTENKISFSSPQKLSYENKLEPYRINPVSGRMQPIDSDQDKKTLPKNVVNLRD